MREGDAILFDSAPTAEPPVGDPLAVPPRPSPTTGSSSLKAEAENRERLAFWDGAMELLMKRPKFYDEWRDLDAAKKIIVIAAFVAVGWFVVSLFQATTGINDAVSDASSLLGR